MTSPGEIQSGSDEVLKDIRDLLEAILLEMRSSSRFLEEGFGEESDEDEAEEDSE